MPPKRGTGTIPKIRIDSQQQLRKVTANLNTTAPKTFTVAPLIIEGVNMNKLEMNDLIKKEFSQIKLNNILLSRKGVFTLQAMDVSSFNIILNELQDKIKALGHKGAKIFVPRSIQRIKDTEKIAFAKRVDLEIPNGRILEALKEKGLLASDVTRLTTKETNKPTGTIKITLEDPANRNTLVKTGLQIDAMFFQVEAAKQNVAPVQCFQCLNFNHVAKYCKEKQQKCVRCGEDHKSDQCIADKEICRNCKGPHSATSKDCPRYLEQVSRMQGLVKQYETKMTEIQCPWKPTVEDFPLLQSSQVNNMPLQSQDQQTQQIIDKLTQQMERGFEETAKKWILPLQKRIEELEKRLAEYDLDMESSSCSSMGCTISSLSDNSDSDFEKKKTKATKPTKQAANKNTTDNTTVQTTKGVTTKKTETRKQVNSPSKQRAAKTRKRNRSLIGSPDSTIETKGLKINDEVND